MKRFKLTSIFALIAAIVFVSCDKDFEEINVDPNNPTAIPSHLLLPSAVRQMQNTNYSTFVGGEFAGWAQQVTKVQYNDEERYIPRESVVSSTWSNYFAIGISDAYSMSTLAEAEGNSKVMAVGLILQAYGYSILTDIYGDFRFSEAMSANEGIISPAYDPQAAVYTGILGMLDTAMTLINGEGSIDATSDILYYGDASGWEKFAASLKFRALMRISGKSDVSGDLNSLISSGKLFGSNDDEAKLIYEGSDPSANPLYESIVFGTRGEWKVNSVLVDMLQNNDDPRLSVMVGLNDADEYRGKPAGIESVPNDDYNYANVSPLGDFYLRPEAPGYFVSYAELQFLMAEAAIEGMISGSAQAYYDKGLDASFAANGILQADADAFKTQTGTPLSVVNNDALEQIGNQKWIAMFTQGIESWTEQRRTGFPVLSPAIDGNISEIPSRFTYPTIESSINGANYSAAVASQGADLLTTKVWWNK
jgi:hypothetical protein